MKMEELQFMMSKIFAFQHGKESYTIIAPYPGLTREDIGVRVKDTNDGLVLVISTSVDTIFNDKSITRSIPLPLKADKNNVVAEVKNGLLTVEVFKLKDRLDVYPDVK